MQVPHFSDPWLPLQTKPISRTTHHHRTLLRYAAKSKVTTTQHICCVVSFSLPELTHSHSQPHAVAPLADSLFSAAGSWHSSSAVCVHLRPLSGIQMPTPDSSVVPRWGIPPVYLLTRLVSVSDLLRHHRLLSDAPIFQPSAIELFRSLLPDPDCGTLCLWTSRRRRQCLFSGNVWRPISSVFPPNPLQCNLFILTYLRSLKWY